MASTAIVAARANYWSFDSVMPVMAESYKRLQDREHRFTGFKHHAKVHSFRFMTVILAWLLIAAAFYQWPEILTALQRLIQHGMEAIGDTIPSPWGPRIEFVFREIGGFHMAADYFDSCFTSYHTSRNCKYLAPSTT